MRFSENAAGPSIVTREAAIVSWDPLTARQITIAIHPGREIDRPTLAKILKQAGYSLQEFWNR